MELTKDLNELFNNLENKGFIKQFFVREGYSKTNLFVRFEALEKDDYPNGIAENGKYVRFLIDLGANKVELYGTGHIWLNEADSHREKYKFYAMRGMYDIAEENGIKKFRKCKFKNPQDLFNKMNNYFQNVMKYVSEYTNGYPYNPKEY